MILGAYTGFSHEILAVLGVLLCAAVFALSRSPGGLRAAWRSQFPERRALYVVTLCLLLVPVGFLVEGLVGTWLFTDRYLQPVTVGLAYLTAELTAVAVSLPALRAALRQWPRTAVATLATAGLGFAALTLFWVFHHVAMNTPEAPDFTDQLTAHLPHDLPVVVDDAFTFTGLMSRQANSGVDYTYLLDWPSSTAPGAPRLEVTQYHLMENWRLAGYYPENIRDIASFLRQSPRFLVIHNAVIHTDPKLKQEIGNPLTERFAHNPAYTVRPYFILDRTYHDGVRDTVSLVCRGGCGAEPPANPDHCVLWSEGTTCCNAGACSVPVPEDQPRHSLWPFKKTQ